MTGVALWTVLLFQLKGVIESQRQCQRRREMTFRVKPFISLLFITQIFFITLILFPRQSNAAQIRALLVGIDEYRSPAVSDLRGCVNDVEMMKHVLLSGFGVESENIRLLKNEQATRDGILSAIQTHLIDKARQGDIIILHYSGHGSRMIDVSGDEVDRFDETIVPHDGRTEGVFDIADDEINGVLRKLNEKTKYVTFIFDSCHSGSAARAGNVVRQIPPDPRLPPGSSDSGLRGGEEGSSDFRARDSEYVLISGCLAGELSNEATFNNQRHGALTWYLAQALLSATSSATYRSVMEEVAAHVSARFSSQHPQLEGSGGDLQVFGIVRESAVPTIPITMVDGKSVTIAAGKIHGLDKDSKLNVFPKNVSDYADNSAVGTIRVTAAKAFTAVAEIIKGDGVRPGDRAIPESLFDSGAPVPVYIGGDAPDSKSKLRQSLEDIPGILMVDREADGILIVEIRKNTVFFSFGDLEQAAKPVSLSTREWDGRAEKTVRGLVHMLALQELSNPVGNIQIAFSVRSKSDDETGMAAHMVPPGTLLTYRLKNLDSVPVFIYVLDVSSDGGFATLFPESPGAQEQLMPGDVLERDIETYLPQGYTAVSDLFLAIATTTPIDPLLLQHPSSQRGGEQGSYTPPARYLTEASENNRGARPVRSKTWVTKKQIMVVRDPGVALGGFALHFDREMGEEEVQLDESGSRSICSENQNSRRDKCFERRNVSEDGTEWLVRHQAGQRNAGEVVTSVGGAFDEAYDIQEKLKHSIRVEPIFEVETDGAVNQNGIIVRDVTSDDTHDPAAEMDDAWHVKQIKAENGWKTVRERHGMAAGKEADGIFIAHTDTGYLDHPETWEKFGGQRPIDAAKGYDYYDDDDDPVDPLLEDRILDNPAHGTASGSVIISPAGCQLHGGAGCVNGIGRGARLIPLRVHRTVSQFNSSNLSLAIKEVAEGKIEGDPRLVSIAMGGPPTLSMWKAVRKAEAKGVLVVAAAGNYVRTVVWPARFDSTIAVAACNVRCRPWKNSSRGDKVDITAPGESVWRASYDMKKGKHINGMGKGTTFATGNTSGAAAVWLAYHRNDPRLAQLQKDGKLTRVFRRAVQRSAWKPPEEGIAGSCEAGRWDEDKFGPGILDLELLLKEPLIEGEHVSEPAELVELPLYSSLFPRGTEPAEIRNSYASLFREERSGLAGKPEIFETEILYHYTTDQNVQSAIDAQITSTRSMRGVERVVNNLQRKDLSVRLRSALKSF